ncbi:MAG: transposase, partial [Pseudomonadota bacterium]
ASELLGRLAALVPPKGFNLTRYHGCLAPRSSIRDLIVPAPPAPDETDLLDDRPADPVATLPARPRRIPWAELLRRVFQSEVDRCAWGGPRRPAKRERWERHRAGRLPRSGCWLKLAAES